MRCFGGRSLLWARLLATLGTAAVLGGGLVAVVALRASHDRDRRAQAAVAELRRQAEDARRCQDLLADRLDALEWRIAGALEEIRGNQRALLRAIGAPRDESAKAQARHPPGDGPDER